MASDTQSVIPSHHARRPMNAFLIFCKRHRNVVKERYPNLENRCITKILGEWWAGLDNSEKSDYTNLAKQYKDAFFTANPDFKWYKLPAPSLRLLSTHPENSKSLPLFFNKQDNNETELNALEIEGLSEERQLERGWGILNSMKSKEKHHISNVFSPGKLADENQLGSLRNLFDDVRNCNNNNENDDHSILEKTTNDLSNFQNNNNFTDCNDEYQNKDTELEHALQETNAYIINVFEEQKSRDNKHSYIYNRPKISFNEISVKNYEPNHETNVKIETANKPKQKFETYASQNNFNFETCDLYFPKKSPRSCKGKRYEEFKNKGLINTKSKNTSTNRNSILLMESSENPEKIFYNDVKSFKDPNMVQEVGNSENNCLVNDYKSSDHNDVLKDCEEEKMCTYLDEDSSILSKGKLFHPSDFDLDGKINALPLLNLEQFLIKKKENKNTRKQMKKHINKQKFDEGENKSINKNGLTTIQKDNFNDTSQHKTAVGSRKRKAVKQRITHLEFSDPSSYDIKYKNIAFHERTYLSDLSTLAEVAAKSSKISTTN